MPKDQVTWERPWTANSYGLRVVKLEGGPDHARTEHARRVSDVLMVERDDRDSQGGPAWFTTEDPDEREEAIGLAYCAALEEAQRGQARPFSAEQVIRIAYLLGCERVPMSELGANVVGVLEHMAKELNAQHGEPIQGALGRVQGQLSDAVQLAHRVSLARSLGHERIGQWDDLIDAVHSLRDHAGERQSDLGQALDRLRLAHRIELSKALGLTTFDPESDTWGDLMSEVRSLRDHAAELKRALGEERGKVDVQPKVAQRIVAPTAREHARERQAPTGAGPEQLERGKLEVVSAAIEASANAKELYELVQHTNRRIDAALEQGAERGAEIRKRLDALESRQKTHDDRLHELHGWTDPNIEKLAARVEKLEGWRERLSSRPNGADVLVSLDKRTDERDWLVKRVEERLDALEKLAQGTADALDTHKTLAHERLDELEAAWGRAPLREWVESKFDAIEKRVDDRAAQYAFDEFKAAVETWQAAHAQTVANLAKNVASIDLAFGGLAAAMTTGRDAVSDWQKKVDETVRQFGEAGNLLRGDVAALAQKVDGIEANGWHRVNDGAFGPPFGTLRVCVDCGAIVAGGPTRCVRCATDGELIAELGTKTDAIVRRADSGAEALVQLGVLVSELRAKIDRIDERTRTPEVRSNSKKLIPLESATALVTCARDVVDVRGVIGDVPHHSLRSRIDELGRALANFERNTTSGR